MMMMYETHYCSWSVLCIDAAVGEGIQQLSLGGAGDAAGLRGPGSQRRGALRYIGNHTRPPHVTNKKGHIHAVCATSNASCC